MLIWLSLLFALGFTVIHLTAKYMTFFAKIPRNRFLSAAGGVSVSYVFIHLMPDLSKYQEKFSEKINNDFIEMIEHHVYIVALLGLAVFYGLERMAKKSKLKNNTQTPSTGVFWIHICSFFLYNLLIGYLLIRENESSLQGMIFYFLALSVHFITNDLSLREDHKTIYDKYGRWILASAVLIGWFTGVYVEVKEIILSLLISFLAGGIILNVMKEELPKERQSSFTAFATGVIGYTILLVALTI